MGQNVTVVEKKSSNPGVLRFEINRSLTGMGHERYASVEDVMDDRVVDVLARRLFETGEVDSIHINSSVITVRLASGNAGSDLLGVIQNLFRFYGAAVPEEVVVADGPPVDEVVEPDAAAAPEATSTEEAAKDATVADDDDAPKETDTSSSME